MKKKLLHFVFVFLLAICMTNLKNTCSYAYNTNFDEFYNDIRAKFNILKENGVISNSFNVNNLSTIYEGYDYVIILRHDDLQQNGTYSKIFTAVWNRKWHNSLVNSTYNNSWGYADRSCQVRGYNTTTGNVTDSWYNSSLRSWNIDYAYTTIAIDTSNMILDAGEEYGQYYITEPPSTFNFVFYDTSHTATTPDGETAYCVFVDPLATEQKIGYIENYSEHLNTQLFIFAINYRNASDPIQNSIGETNYYLNESRGTTC